jgi:transposase
LQEQFKDLFNIPLATATLNRFSQNLYDTLEVFEQEVFNKISQAVLKHLDETGFRIAGKTQWLHVASNEHVTYYHYSPKRKSLLEGLTGTVVHDHWKAYYQLEGVSHALCNAHHLRELNALIEDKERWAFKMKRFLVFALRYRKAYQDQNIPPVKLDRLIELYHQIVDEGLTFHNGLPMYKPKAARGRIKRRTGHNLLLRLQNYCSDVLRFLTDPNVPFTNNQAERDIRMMKCKQKISGGFRTIEGAKIFIRIRGFISTARKQGWNILSTLSQALMGRLPTLS